MAPSCEPTWRWMPRARSAGPASRVASSAAASSVSVIPNFDPPAPDRETGMRLGRDVRVQAKQDVDRRSPRPAEARRPRSVGEHTELRLGFDGHPAQRVPVGGCRDGRPQVTVGLADAFERDRCVGHAGARCERPLAAGDDVGTRAGSRRGARDDCRDVIRLDRVLADPRIRERGLEFRTGGGQGDRIGDIRRRAKPPRGRSEPGGDQGQAVGVDLRRVAGRAAHEPRGACAASGRRWRSQTRC